MLGVGLKLGSLDVSMSDAPTPLRWIGQGLLRLAQRCMCAVLPSFCPQCRSP